MFPVLCLVSVVPFASPAESATTAVPPPQILVMGLEHSADVQADVARTLTDLITLEVAKSGAFKTLSSGDLQNLLALEGEKQAAGCDDDVGCIAEIASAMGARFVIFGRVSKLGDIHVVNLNLLDALNAAPISRSSLQTRDLEEVVGTIAEAVAPLLDEGRAHLAREGVTLAEEPAAEVEGGFSLLLTAGATAGALGVLLAGLGAASAGVMLLVYFTEDSAPLLVRQAAPWASAGLGLVAVLGLVVVAGGATTAALSFME